MNSTTQLLKSTRTHKKWNQWRSSFEDRVRDLTSKWRKQLCWSRVRWIIIRPWRRWHVFIRFDLNFEVTIGYQPGNPFGGKGMAFWGFPCSWWTSNTAQIVGRESMYANNEQEDWDQRRIARPAIASDPVEIHYMLTSINLFTKLRMSSEIKGGWRQYHKVT